MPHPALAPVFVCAMASAGFASNEWSHGGVSAAMGMGHHHMMDDAQAHCQGHYGGMQAMGGNMTQMMQRCRAMMANESMMDGSPHQGMMGGGSP